MDSNCFCVARLTKNVATNSFPQTLSNSGVQWNILKIENAWQKIRSFNSETTNGSLTIMENKFIMDSEQKESLK